VLVALEGLEVEALTD
jgi:hypothetical protein